MRLACARCGKVRHARRGAGAGRAGREGGAPDVLGERRRLGL